MHVVAVDVGQRLHCPQCHAQDFQRDSYEIDECDHGKVEAVAWLARKAGIVEAVSKGSTEVDSESLTALIRKETTSIPALSESGLIPEAKGRRSDRSEDSMSDSSKIGLGILPENARLGKYEIRRVLGQGGMGIVYEAFDTDLDRSVALKVLNRDLCKNPRFIDRFKREARAAARLSHPNITHVYSIGEEDGNHFFAMEFVDGKNLGETLEAEGAMPLVKAIDIVRQTAVGLRVAHQQTIVHRDIKPSNLLVTPDGELKITDFGLAKAVMGSALELTTTGVVMGTPIYMSPEQGRGKPCDHRSDIYSLGASFYHLVVGRVPFVADSPIATILKHLNEAVSFPDDCDLSEPVCAVIRKMMAKTVDDRYEDYDDLIADLDRLITGDEVAAAENPNETRVVVVNYARSKASTANLFRVGKLSLARTNLKLGRREKAIAMLEEVVSGDNEASLRAEAGLMLLEIHEKAGDVASARRMAETVARCEVEGASTFAIWKLARYDTRESLDRERSALSHFERLLLRASPDHRPIIDTQIARIRSRIAAIEQELSLFEVILVEE